MMDSLELSRRRERNLKLTKVFMNELTLRRKLFKYYFYIHFLLSAAFFGVFYAMFLQTILDIRRFWNNSNYYFFGIFLASVSEKRTQKFLRTLFIL